MSIYEKELEEVDEIFNEVKQIVENASLGSKVKIVRMFSAAKREYEQNKIIDALRQKVGHEKSIFEHPTSKRKCYSVYLNTTDE